MSRSPTPTPHAALRSVLVPAGVLLAAMSLTACHKAPAAETAAGASGAGGGALMSREQAQAHPKLAKHFDEIDTDHDGNLSRAEIHAWREARAAAQAASGATEVAAAGPVASGAAPAAGPGMGGHAGGGLLHRLDTNGDGQIQRAEAASEPRLAARFDEIDTNHDGVLSREELRAARQKMHHGHAASGAAAADDDEAPDD